MGLNSTWLLGESKCDYVTESWGLGPRHSKASKQTRLVERKVCFISDAGNWGLGETSVQRPLPPLASGGETFHRLRPEPPCRNSVVSSDGHLQVGHVWSEQHHLHCFRDN